MALQPVPVILSQRGINLIVLVAVFLALATVCLALRLYTNHKYRGKLTAPDWLVLAAYVFYWGHATVIILTCLVGGLGFHQWTIDPVYVINNNKLGLGQQTAYGLELGLVKCSLCLLFIQVFATEPAFKIAAYVVLTLCAAWAVMTILIAFLDCQPLAFFWNHSIPGGHCDDIGASWTAIGCVDVILDVAILTLPIPMIWNLRMSNWKKFAVLGIFALGIITIAIGIVRTVTFSRVDLNDWTWQGYYPVIWSSIEPPIAIMVVCCMSLKPLVVNKGAAIPSTIRHLTSRLFRSGDSIGSDQSDRKPVEKPAEFRDPKRFAGLNVGRGMMSLLESQDLRRGDTMTTTMYE